jgi:hypothetical protein
LWFWQYRAEHPIGADTFILLNILGLLDFVGAIGGGCLPVIPQLGSSAVTLHRTSCSDYRLA